MKIKLIIGILTLLLSFSSNSQNYTVYNNLTTIANKFVEAKRYNEACYIYSTIDDIYRKLFKTTDLYYWSLALSKIGNDNLSFQKLKRSIILSNENINILWKVKNNKQFDYLTSNQIIDLEKIPKPSDIYTNLDSTIVDTLKNMLYKDYDIQDSISSLFQNYEKNSPEFNKLQEWVRNENNKLSKQFVEMINKYGYPDNKWLKSDCELLLFHIEDSTLWNSIEIELQKGLKNGKIRPFVYAYSYFRSHNRDDLFGALTFPEIKSTSNKNEFKLLIQNKVQLGLGL